MGFSIFVMVLESFCLPAANRGASQAFGANRGASQAIFLRFRFRSCVGHFVRNFPQYLRVLYVVDYQMEDGFVRCEVVLCLV